MKYPLKFCVPLHWFCTALEYDQGTISPVCSMRDQLLTLVFFVLLLLTTPRVTTAIMKARMCLVLVLQSGLLHMPHTLPGRQCSKVVLCRRVAGLGGSVFWCVFYWVGVFFSVGSGCAEMLSFTWQGQHALCTRGMLDDSCVVFFVPHTLVGLWGPCVIHGIVVLNFLARNVIQLATHTYTYAHTHAHTHSW